MAIGERNARAILTEPLVREIRASATGKRGEVTALSEKYGIRPNCIRKVIKRVTWKHVP
jgi:hypothetical protein